MHLQDPALLQSRASRGAEQCAALASVILSPQSIKWQLCSAQHPERGIKLADKEKRHKMAQKQIAARSIDCRLTWSQKALPLRL